MEPNFILLILAALAGMVARTFVGWDPWKLFAALGLILLVLPALGLVFETDPEATQEAANRLVERFANAMPSIIVGGVAGMIAGSIVDAVEGLVKGP